MKLDILISTFNERIQNVPSILLDERKDVYYKISFQVTDEKYLHIPSLLLERKDVLISVIYSKGISNNRNNALRMSTSDYCLIADDDVCYTNHYIDDIFNLLKCNKNIDIFIGKIYTGKNEREYKSYKSNSHKIGWMNYSQVSSIEIIFKRVSLIHANILFDSNFGLGGDQYTQGEEVIFLSDCLKKGLNIKYFPVYFVQHPYESSGKMVVFDCEHVMYWGALCKRVYGHLAYLLLFVLLVKHFFYWRKKMSIREYIYAFYQGVQKYKKK